MAGGSTHLSSTGNELGYFPGKLTESFPVWTASVPSPGNPGIIFPDDEGAASGSGNQINGHNAPQGRILHLKDIFHRGRHLLIKHLPPDVTEEDVRNMVPKNLPEIKSIVIPTCIDERERRSHSITVKVFLSDPTFLDGFQTVSTTVKVKEQLVSVAFSPSPTDALLCVAHLPFSMAEEDFQKLVEKFGSVKRAFLMRSSRTGESKGYGFVEYEQKESAFMAKSCLDSRGPENGLSLDGFSPLTPTLSCDWLDSGIVSLAALESKCLCIRGLPKDFRDMSELRNVMSCHVNPPYCQIALKQGSPQDFGLVEFETAEQAEKTLEMRHGFPFHGKKLSVSYCLPGQRAINIYMKILHDHGNRGNSALLPDPTATSVVKRLQNLARNNPTFAQNLQNIILTQIHDIQEGAFKNGDEADNSHGNNGKWQQGRWNRNKNHRSANAHGIMDHKPSNMNVWSAPAAPDMSAVDEQGFDPNQAFQRDLPAAGLCTDFAVAGAEASNMENPFGNPQARANAWARNHLGGSNPNASVVLLNSLLQAAEAASNSQARQNPHSQYPFSPQAQQAAANSAAMSNIRETFSKMIQTDPESLKQLMTTIFPDSNGIIPGNLQLARPPQNGWQPGFNGFQHQPQPQLMFENKPPEIPMIPAHLAQQQALAASMEGSGYLIGAPWYAVQAPDHAAMLAAGFGMPGPTVLPSGVVPWGLQPDPSMFSNHPAAVVAAQNALMRKRKLPPFGYQPDPNALSAAAFTFSQPDPFKRKRQF